MMEVRPLSKHVGAEIRGVDVSKPLTDDIFKKIDDAYNYYSVLVFRDQKLTPEQQIAFSRLFGELEISPRTQFALPGYPEILVLSNIVVDGQPIGNADAGRTWHTDMSYTKTPPRGSLLYAREVPFENGRALGDTIFSSAAAAYDALSPEMKKKLTGLRAISRRRQEVCPRQQARRFGEGHAGRRTPRNPDTSCHRSQGHLCA
jgi:taurine dioxygenase